MSLTIRSDKSHPGLGVHCVMPFQSIHAHAHASVHLVAKVAPPPARFAHFARNQTQNGSRFRCA